MSNKRVGDSMGRYVVMLEDDSGLEVRELKTTRKDLAELEFVDVTTLIMREYLLNFLVNGDEFKIIAPDKRYAEDMLKAKGYESVKVLNAVYIQNVRDRDDWFYIALAEVYE